MRAKRGRGSARVAGSGSDSTESRPVTGRKETPTGGPHLSAVEEMESGAGPDWAGKREMGRRYFPGPRGEKRKGNEEGELGQFGLKRFREKERVFHF